MRIDRRALLSAGGALVLLAGAALTRRGGHPARAAEMFEITRTPAEWRGLLTPAQYSVLREAGTEPPNSSPLEVETRQGLFACAGCDLSLFRSDDKFDSGTGWPSFSRPIDGAVGTSVDSTFFMTRTEVHCHRCGGHLGHVFPDGPKPTGLRYCMNGVAMNFHAAAGAV